MSTEPKIRVFSRAMPLDLFTGMATTEEWLELMRPDWRLQGQRKPLEQSGEYKEVKALQSALNDAYSRQDEDQTGEWVICLPLADHPFAQPVAVVRKYSNNGNTYIATRWAELGFIMAPEILPLGSRSYDRWL